MREPYAKVLAERAALVQPDRILETAAGTGIVTRALHLAVPHAQIVATDVNPVMLEVAAQRLDCDSVSFQPADAQDLPFDSAASTLWSASSA
jgi:ubiquinone/menaquinone biosynthesis C-methylase UbiE